MKAASAFFTRNKKPGYKANMKLYTLHRILERISAANIYKTSSAFRSICFLSIYSPCSLSLSLSLYSRMGSTLVAVCLLCPRPTVHWRTTPSSPLTYKNSLLPPSLLLPERRCQLQATSNHIYRYEGGVCVCVCVCV